MTWEVRVHWKPAGGVTCPAFTTYVVSGESCAVDEAVSVLDGCRHPKALVKAVSAEVRRAGDPGPWRAVSAGPRYL